MYKLEQYQHLNSTKQFLLFTDASVKKKKLWGFTLSYVQNTYKNFDPLPPFAPHFPVSPTHQHYDCILIGSSCHVTSPFLCY